MMRLLLFLMATAVYGQTPATGEDQLKQSIQELTAQVRAEQEEIDTLVKLLAPPKKRHHSKKVQVLLKVLQVVDHVGSIASIYSTRGL